MVEIPPSALKNAHQGTGAKRAGRDAHTHGHRRGARLPEGVTGPWYELEPGQVQFAGVVLGGLGGRPVLVLEFAGKARADQFSVALQEVTARENLQDLTTRVQPREHPLWVRQVER